MQKQKKQEMGTTTNPFKEHHNYHPLPKKLITSTLYALFPISLFFLYFYSLPHFQSSTIHVPPHNNNRIILTSPPQFQGEKDDEIECDYTNGKWVHDNKAPLYNDTACRTIKDGRNCINHGRPDLDYLNWRWKPNQCHLPRFEPDTFLQLLRNRHVAFVGDSLARNQLESLLCLLSSVSSPVLVYTSGDDNKFRKWHFWPHNVTVSIYWSPFLVKGVEKSNDGDDYNKLYVDMVDERWARDLDYIDMIVFSIGHWFLHSAVYYEKETSVLGCHSCSSLNHTETGFYDVFGKAIKTTLDTIIQRRSNSDSKINVFLTTFSPAHFDGEWDKVGACAKTMPENEKVLEGMDSEMREVEVREVEKAAKHFDGMMRLEVLDVTKLSSMRPDGHPGPYMYALPFADGVPERVRNDCVHWCLPGPIDTWNEILLMLMKRWDAQSRK